VDELITRLEEETGELPKKSGRKSKKRVRRTTSRQRLRHRPKEAGEEF